MTDVASGRPSRRLFVSLGVIAAAHLALGIVVGQNRYAVLLAVLGGERDPAQAYRTLVLLESSTLLIASGALVLHLFARRWWSLTPLLLASTGMVAAISLNLPPRYGRYGAETDFVEQFGRAVRDDVLAQAVYDATFAATLTIIVGLLFAVPWAILVRHFGDWRLSRSTGRQERILRVVLGSARWFLPIALVGVILLIAR